MKIPNQVKDGSPPWCFRQDLSPVARRNFHQELRMPGVSVYQWYPIHVE